MAKTWKCTPARGMQKSSKNSLAFAAKWHISQLQRSREIFLLMGGSEWSRFGFEGDVKGKGTRRCWWVVECFKK